MREVAGERSAGRDRCVALGNFDGVHLGHRAVLERALQEARERGLVAVAATFDPHPRAVLRPESPPKLLSDLRTRKRLLLEAGMAAVEVVRFDRELSKRTPEEFVREVLVGRLGARVVVVGENFRFGYRASGDLEVLGRLMRAYGGEAFGVGVRREGEAEISSTRIRSLLLGGDVKEAARLLGRNYEVSGPVVAGDRRGRTIGFPTANVLPEREVLVPGRGVYACRARLGERVYPACVNVGVAPTFGERESRVEAHLLDFEGDIYGEEVRVEFVERVREERKFAGVEELAAQIRRDVASARRVLEEESARGFESFDAL